MENFNNELLEKAKQTKSAEELLALAKENKIEMTDEQAAAYYEQLHPTSGEIADDELENVAGGGCGDSLRNGDRVHLFYGCPKCGCHFAYLVCNPYFIGAQCEQCNESFWLNSDNKITKL